MLDLAAFQGRQFFWILALNTLLHELGVPLPMMPTALVAGARAVPGAIDSLVLIAAIVAGTLIGNSVWFAAGRRYGAGVLKLLCRLSLSADTCVSRTESAFGRWGWSSLVVGRFLPGVSLVAPPLAGALGMKWSRFLVLTGAGAALYGLVVVGAGMLLRDQIESALQQLAGLGWQALAAVAVVLALYIVGRWWWRRRVARSLDVSRISVDELQKLIAAGEAPVLVDVRGATTQRLDPRRIPGAIAVQLDAIEAGLDELPRDRQIVLYCACPNEASAAKAARLLLDRGYTRARPLLGGLDAWIVAGHAVETAAWPPGDPALTRENDDREPERGTADQVQSRGAAEGETGARAG
jgi:membrane protein DedA with SNARE-associated domain/rhodanese-related sulfurtransferase